ncbi:unnamed protein product [Umbelopsis ramanniana]
MLNRILLKRSPPSLFSNKLTMSQSTLRIAQVSRHLTSAAAALAPKAVASALDHKLCMIPGPIEFHEDVLKAMATPATSHVDPLFIPIFGESIELLRKVLLTESAQPFIVSGSGTLGWDMMVNLIEKGDKALVCNTGYFGDRFGECLSVYGANVTNLKAPIGGRPTLQEIEKALRADKYKMITITHVDTSTGVLSDIKAVAELTRRVSPDTLVVVDGVCSVGSEEIRFDEWDLDVVITGSQKGLGVPPGLSIVIASQRALSTFQNRESPIASYFSNWQRWLPVMQAYESRKPSYFATPAVQLIYALNASLKHITAEPMEVRFEKHAKASQDFKKFITDIGLKQLAVSPQGAANGMTAVYYPKGVTGPELVASMAKKGVQIAGGLHEQIAAQYFRVGHMGISVTEPGRNHIVKVVDALKASLGEQGYITK